MRRRAATTISIRGSMAWRRTCSWLQAKETPQPWMQMAALRRGAMAMCRPATHCACFEGKSASRMTSVPGNSQEKGAIAINTEELCRHYRMAETLIRAVDGISLQVRGGEFVALLGSSGSGKSSMLNLIAGLDRPTSGTVLVQERDLARLSREELAKYRLHVVGMVFQSFNLIASMTLAENVVLPLRLSEVDRSKRDVLAKAALERVGLGARMHHRPSELSGGEHQRAALARALINRPHILPADQPTRTLANH